MSVFARIVLENSEDFLRLKIDTTRARAVLPAAGVEFILYTYAREVSRGDPREAISDRALDREKKKTKR